MNSNTRFLSNHIKLTRGKES